jgi:hypothetical protein
MKRLLGLLIAANLLVLAANSGTLINLAHSSITEWSTSAGSNTSSVGTEGMSENAAPSSVNDSYREGLAQVTRLARQAVLSSFGPASYTVSAYYITPALVPAAAISGQVFSFVPTTQNIGSATLRVGTLAEKTIVKLSNSTLATGDLQAGTAAMVLDGGTYYHLLNPAVNTIAANSITTGMIASSVITLSNIAAATSGTIMTWNTFGTPSVVTPGILGHVLTSGGPNAVPQFQSVTASILRGSSITLSFVAASVTHVTAHNLTGMPDYIDAVYVANTEECGYGTGDKVAMTLDKTANLLGGVQVVKTATSIKLVIGANFTYLFNPTSGASCLITAANWGIHMTPYKFNTN